MYARSTTWRGNPQAIDDAVAYARDEAMPMITAMDGSAGMSMLCDRESGRCIVSTSWKTEEAMRASGEKVVGSRDRAGEILGDADPEVSLWEVAVMHRVHEGPEGARARVIWGETDPAHVEDAVSAARMSASRMEELPGFCSASFMVDRSSGRCAVTICYDSLEDMRRADDMAASLRSQITQAMGMRMTDMAEFDLMVHHLRVPETV